MFCSNVISIKKFASFAGIFIIGNVISITTLFVEIMSCGSLKNCLSHLQDITIYIPVERVIKHILKGQTFYIN